MRLRALQGLRPTPATAPAVAAVPYDVVDTEEARALLLALCPAGFEELELPGRIELAAYVDAAGEARLTRAFPQAAVQFWASCFQVIR